MSAAELGRGIGAGAIDPRTLCETYLTAIAAHPEAARIYVRTTPRRARAEADAAAGRARLGLRRGPLDGVPVSWKDVFDLAGEPTEAGSALLRGRVASHDAAVVASAARAGVVSLGKTHLSELAFSGLGINPMTATAPNINDPEIAPGGSSSGAAASVAFGLAAAGIGSDTAGSARVPAAWNDLVGFKPTHGLLPLAGVTPLRPQFDTVGPLCRSVEDAALLLSVLSGGPAPDLAGATLAGARLLVLDDAETLPTDDGPAAAFEAALERVAAAGARIERGLPQAVASAMRLWSTVAGPEAYGVWRAAIDARPDLMWAPIRDRFRLAATITGADHIAALRALDEAREVWRAEVAGFDAVLLPATANLPPRVDRLLSDPVFYAAQNLAALRNTNLANLLRLCALSVPTGIPACGVMVLAPAGAEGRLLRLGAAIEAALA
ncbi:amidase [Amaricoccus sp.]|uniref:amidase n=1 Tax=Amaricoccus sp. TaxID=1872485 RepID=UPI001B57120B|nr:amidase family protein [Amaricoccus sp.]MBP7242735.1 amidase [Amaricoccus sp.]